MASPCNGALTGNDSFSLLIGGWSCDSSCESVGKVKGESENNNENNKAVRRLDKTDGPDNVRQECIIESTQLHTVAQSTSFPTV